jgi:hypothetical protein
MEDAAAKEEKRNLKSVRPRFSKVFKLPLPRFVPRRRLHRASASLLHLLDIERAHDAGRQRLHRRAHDGIVQETATCGEIRIGERRGVMMRVSIVRMLMLMLMLMAVSLVISGRNDMSATSCCCTSCRGCGC